MNRSKFLTAGAVFGFFALAALPNALAESPQMPPSSEMQPLSFTETYQAIVNYYPRLKSQKAKVEQAVAEKFEAYSALFPRVDGTSAFTLGDDPVYVFGSLLRQEQFSTSNFNLSGLNSPRHRTNFNFSLQGRIPLFNAFQTMSRIRSSKFLQKSESDRKALIQMEAGLLSIESYLKGLLFRENLAQVRQVKQASLSDLQQADELKTKGMVLGADFYAAKVISSEIKQINTQTEGWEKLNRILLAILMGQTPENSRSSLSGTIPGAPEKTRPLQEWLDLAYESRPDLKALAAQVEALRINAFREKMSALPRVEGFGEVTEDSHDLKTGGENYVMGVKGSVNVIDAGYWARRKKAKAAYQTLQADYQTLKDQAAKEISQAVNGFETLRENLPDTDEAFRDAQEAVKQTEVLYREGRKSIADLLEIRRAFLHTAFQKNDLLFQTALAYAQLLFLSGTLDEPAMTALAQHIDQTP